MSKNKVVIGIVLVLLLVGGYFLLNNTSTSSQQDATTPVTEITSLQSYTNAMYGFSVQYPTSWVTVPFASADIIPGFKPKDDKNYDIPYAFAMTIREGCGLAKSTVPFEQFKKWVDDNGASEVQGYSTVNTSMAGTTTSGVAYYKVTWNKSLGSVSPDKTSTVAYIQLPMSVNNNYCLEFDYGDQKYATVVDQMLASFSFTQ